MKTTKTTALAALCVACTISLQAQHWIGPSNPAVPILRQGNVTIGDPSAPNVLFTVENGDAFFHSGPNNVVMASPNAEAGLSLSTAVGTRSDIRFNGARLGLYVNALSGTVPTLGMELDGDGNASLPAMATYQIGGVRALAYDNTNFNLFVGNSGNPASPGTYNAFTGDEAGLANSASYGVFTGYQAGKFNSGDGNVLTGYQAGFNNRGRSNTFSGYQAGYKNYGDYNTFTGYQAGQENSGTYNVFNGFQAGQHNSGFYNVFLGFKAGQVCSGEGSSNIFIGYESGRITTSGGYNTCTGSETGASNVSGDNNCFYGFYSGSQTTASDNAFFGFQSGTNNIRGTFNTAVGSGANVGAATMNNATALGAGAIVNASNKVRIGNAAVTVVEGPVAYTISDGRFKTNVRTEDVKGLSFIKKLRPVVYNFDAKKFTEFLTKSMPDSVKGKYMSADFEPATAIRQSGFIAQEVEQAAKEAGYAFNGVHAPDSDNDNYNLSYSQFVVPLVKAVQEQQDMMEQQKAESQLQIADLQKQLEEQKQLINTLSQKVTGIVPAGGVETGFQLSQNEPNPFTNETIVRYVLPQSVTTAFMAVYDLTGKQITSYTLNEKGASSLTITSAQLAAGIYIYSIVADGKVIDSKRMIVAGK